MIGSVTVTPASNMDSANGGSNYAAIGVLPGHAGGPRLGIPDRPPRYRYLVDRMQAVTIKTVSTALLRGII